MSDVAVSRAEPGRSVALNLLLHDGLSGRGTRKLVDEFRVHPNLFKNLPTGHAIVIRKSHGVHATETLIVPRASRSRRPSHAVDP